MGIGFLPDPRFCFRRSNQFEHFSTQIQGGGI
jgi:hypothetical protein